MQSHGHLKGPNSVHVCSDDGDPSVAALGVPENEAPQQVYLQEDRTITIAMMNSVLLQSQSSRSVY